MTSTSCQLFEKELNNQIGIWYNEIELKGDVISWDWTCIYTVRRRKT